MDLNLYEIVYDQAFIRSNGLISGHFDINSQGAAINSVKFQFWGVSKCCWEQDKPSLFRRNKKFVGSKENLYIENSLTFCENLEEKKRYYFRSKVPRNIPATWEGALGFIKYLVKINVDLPTQQKMFESEVILLPHRDLKMEKHLINESREDINHSFHFAVLNLGFVDISIWLPVSGVAAGQSLPLLCTIKNQSSTIFNSILFVFNQNEIYLSTKPVARKAESYEILVVKRRANITFGSYEYYCVLDTDKKWHPTSQCPKESCCELTYDLKVRIVSSSAETHDKLIIETEPVPIIIGTEPLLEWDTKKITEEITKETFNKKSCIIVDLEDDSELLSEHELA